MKRAFSTRVPHILQNDVRDTEEIRCGPASIQAILYGRGPDSRFEGPSATLRHDVPVEADQEIVWKQVQNQSKAVAHELHGVVGTTEACQVRVGTPRQCWTTHPAAMERVLRQGIDSEGLKLAGNPDVTARMVPETDVPKAIMASLERGTGAAILINQGHWVVAHKTTPLGLTDMVIHFHDPLVRAETSWIGESALFAATLDFDAATPGTQVPVVAAHAPDTGATVAAERPQASTARMAEHLEIATADLRAVLSRAADDVETLAHIPPVAQKRVLHVRHLRDTVLDYKIVQFGEQAMVVVDERTHRPLMMARVTESEHVLPHIMEPEELRAAVGERVIRFSGQDVAISGAALELEPEVVWRSCAQSRSMFIPFYVATVPGGQDGPHRIYLRASDAAPFAVLTDTR